LTITKINAILSYKVKGEDKMIRAEIKKELQELAEKICREESREYPAIHLKHNRRGYTQSTGHISIPIWAIGEGKDYLNYYLIHEVTHWVTNRGHCDTFIEKEKELLSRNGLQAVYSRIYANQIIKNGIVVWDKKKSKLWGKK
jgi:hypothetical protein